MLRKQLVIGFQILIMSSMSHKFLFFIRDYYFFEFQHFYIQIQRF